MRLKQALERGPKGRTARLVVEELAAPNVLANALCHHGGIRRPVRLLRLLERGQCTDHALLSRDVAVVSHAHPSLVRIVALRVNVAPSFKGRVEWGSLGDVALGTQRHPRAMWMHGTLLLARERLCRVEYWRVRHGVWVAYGGGHF